jgi:Male enhanced antigen 1 (MEA1)
MLTTTEAANEAAYISLNNTEPPDTTPMIDNTTPQTQPSIPPVIQLEKTESDSIPEADLAVIQRVMAGIQLPASSFPEWAKRVDDAAWMPVFNGETPFNTNN